MSLINIAKSAPSERTVLLDAGRKEFLALLCRYAKEPSSIRATDAQKALALADDAEISPPNLEHLAESLRCLPQLRASAAKLKSLLEEDEKLRQGIDGGLNRAHKERERCNQEISNLRSYKPADWETIKTVQARADEAYAAFKPQHEELIKQIAALAHPISEARAAQRQLDRVAQVFGSVESAEALMGGK